MDSDTLPIFLVEHLECIAKKEGFDEGYDVQHEAGSKTGDGFMATMVAIKLIGNRWNRVTGKSGLEKLALICKLQPSDARQEAFCSDLLFQREVYMYKKLLPAFDAFQKEHGIPKENRFTCFPKCYEAIHENGNSESVIILEDLRSSGHTMWNKNKNVDFKSVGLVIEQLGRFHGLSFAIRAQKPELFKEAQKLPKHLIAFLFASRVVSVIQSNYKYLISLLDNAVYIDLLEGFLRDMPQIFNDVLDENLLGEYSVLNHGDCWLNNIMFLMDQGPAKSISLIDWQMSRVTSPAIDLTFYLLSATDKSLRDAHMDDFLQIYYSNLANTIRATGSDPEVLFPEAELQRQFRQFGIYGVTMAPMLIPVILADASEIANIDDIADTMVKGTDGDDQSKVIITKLIDGKDREYAQRMMDVLDDTRRYGWI